MPLFEPGGIVADVESEINRLAKKLQKKDGHGRLWQILAWPLDQSGVDRTAEHLHDLQQTLSFLIESIEPCIVPRNA